MFLQVKDYGEVLSFAIILILTSGHFSHCHFLLCLRRHNHKITNTHTYTHRIMHMESTSFKCDSDQFKSWTSWKKSGKLTNSTVCVFSGTHFQLKSCLGMTCPIDYRGCVPDHWFLYSMSVQWPQKWPTEASNLEILLLLGAPQLITTTLSWKWLITCHNQSPTHRSVFECQCWDVWQVRSQLCLRL